MNESGKTEKKSQNPSIQKDLNNSSLRQAQDYQKATFAGGCFWCMEPPYDDLDGVISTTVGYTGGEKPNPTYEEVSTGRIGHAEAVQIVFDSTKISYWDLLQVFWRNIDPTDPYGQFADKGSQYRTAIFYHDEKQKELAEKSKKELEASEKFDSPIVTEIVPASEFHPAEDYHQEFYKNHPLRYNSYKVGSGRTGYLKEKW
ncbi:MAG: peptide-methionine (S)-S-oxide reductase MsrA, partial [Phycisphaerae bacterium]|nr:peptide-methionine (S)-S-oxide reductase MsrA [candidate division Zixibacteria bacterium]NIT51557.1 peptide-methionine (S)-S-oxide reductase MsrA [candidate division Zixibacteria bacterium]NIU55446.1 peptide-methionine (S)-S-oxide reductase MsrA [Phycisphaerae bacterium]NIV96647.1 peptide-methionine (S)-S-oxide reductase MsrA [candidate division KSB1 bacterium]NIW91912.1 peptide-methionine (S)-S-oxide reductase MsrA [Phycisphaerae bacterium]